MLPPRRPPRSSLSNSGGNPLASLKVPTVAGARAAERSSCTVPALAIGGGITLVQPGTDSTVASAASKAAPRARVAPVRQGGFMLRIPWAPVVAGLQSTR